MADRYFYAEGSIWKVDTSYYGNGMFVFINIVNGDTVCTTDTFDIHTVPFIEDKKELEFISVLYE